MGRMDVRPSLSRVSVQRLSALRAYDIALAGSIAEGCRVTWTLTAVPHTEVRQIWSTVAPLLSPAIVHSNGRIDMASVFDWLTDQRYLLWVAYPEDRQIRAAFITRETHYPLKSMLTIDVAGGSDMAGWVNSADATFRAYAVAAGLDGVELFGRPGWTRALKNLGWTGGTVLLETDTAAGVER